MKQLKETILRVCGDNYQCLEADNVEGVDVITVGTPEEPYVLNFEVGDASVSINVIDKDEGSIIDEYEDTFTEDTFTDCVSNAVTTYEAIVKDKEGIRKIQENRSQTQKFDEILNDGAPESFETLSKDELIALDEYIDTAVESNIGRRFAHHAVSSALSKLDNHPVPQADKNQTKFTLGDKVKVNGHEDIGIVVDHITEDPMDCAVGCSSGDFDAWLVEFEGKGTEMVDEKFLTLVTEDVNTISGRIDIPCENDVTIIAEIVAEQDETYKLNCVAGINVNDEFELTIDGESHKLPLNAIHHGILSFTVPCEDKENGLVYRVDSNNCELDSDTKTIKFNAVKSNDLSGEWFASLKVKGNVKDILKDAKVALNESVDALQNNGEDPNFNSNCGIDTPPADASDILASQPIMNLFYAAAAQLSDMAANSEEDTVKVILDDLSAQLEQMIIEIEDVTKA